MTELEENRDKILRGAEEFFHKYGIRSVSMDDIARHLSISKKTIYHFFVDKDEVVLQFTQGHLDRMNIQMENLTSSARNALDELMKISIWMRKTLQDMNPALLFDLKKYHPKAFGIWSDHKDKQVMDEVVRNMKRGIEEGLYRSNLNPEILAILRVETLTMFFDGRMNMNEKFNIADTQLQLLDHFMYGLLTDKGRKLYEKYKQEPTNLELIPHKL